MIIEDRHSQAEMLKEILKEMKNIECEIIGIVTSCNCAISLFKKKQPHLILADVQIKGSMNGVKLIKKLHTISQNSFITIF